MKRILFERRYILEFKKCDCGRPLFDNENICPKCKREVIKIMLGGVILTILAVVWAI